MLYLSVQPDQVYFIWQLEIQLRNLSYLGVSKNNIQVLVAYNEERGLNSFFQEFIDTNNHLAQIYCYPDLRIEPKYTSSIRPNILKQHFYTFPELENRTIFYHDSDILFSRIPKIENLENNDTCYVSDTRDYLDVNFIRKTASEELLDEMLEIVKLPKSKLIEEDSNSGGAQYILKTINASFWEKVEIDSENLFIAMQNYNTRLWKIEYQHKREFRSKRKGIQSWCADMWAVLWNLWVLGKRVEIHSEMDFSWPYSSIEEWSEKSIQHYSGHIENKDIYFRKGEYLNFMPWYDNSLLSIPNTNCSYRIVELIKKRKEELNALRPVYNKTVLVFDGRSVSDGQLQNFEILTNYVQKFIAIDILLIVDNDSLSIHKNVLLLPQLQIFVEKYESIVYFSDMFLLTIDDIQNLFFTDSKKNGKHMFMDIYQVDNLFSEAFSKILDSNLLEQNRGKFNMLELDGYGAIIDVPSFKTLLKSSFSSLELEDTTRISSAYLLK